MGIVNKGNETAKYSRRGFMETFSAAGLGLLGMSAFLQSCAEKKIEAPSAGLVQAYLQRLTGILKDVHERELPNIEKAAGMALHAKLDGHEIYVWLVGGMLSGEMGDNRPGAPMIAIRHDISRAVRNDIVITDDPYSTKDFNERLVKIVGLTRPSLLNKETPAGALENMGTLRIEDTADVLLSCHVPYTDGILEVNGVDFPIGPASGIVHTFLYYALAAEITEGLVKNGILPRVG